MPLAYAVFLMFSATGTVATPVFEERPPLGFEPMPVVKLFPPSGLVLDMLDFLNPANDTYQTILFALNGDIFFAIASGIFIFLTVMMQCFFIICGGEVFNVSADEFRRSCARGFPMAGFTRIAFLGTVIEASGTGFVNMYGLTQTMHLSSLDFVSAVGGLMLSADQLSTLGLERGLDTISEEIVLSCAKGVRFTAYKWFLFVTVLTEFVLFSVVSFVMHPILPVFCILFCGFAIGVENSIVAKEGPRPTWVVCVEAAYCAAFHMAFPINALRAPHVVGRSPFGLNSGEVKATPAWLSGTVRLLRLVLLVAICWFADLPEGVARFSSLGRSMGRSVLETQFISPTAKVALALRACFEGITNQDLNECVLPEDEDMSASTIIFRSFLIFTLCMGLPLTFLGTFCLLICHSEWRKGYKDNMLELELFAKEEEIEEWLVRREQARAFLSVSDMFWEDLGCSRPGTYTLLPTAGVFFKVRSGQGTDTLSGQGTGTFNIIGIRTRPDVAEDAMVCPPVRLSENCVFLVSEIVEAEGGDGGQRFLRLADGRGWVFTHSAVDGRRLCAPCSRGEVAEMQQQQEMLQQVINESPDLVQLLPMSNENPEHFQQVLTQMARVVGVATGSIPNYQEMLQQQINESPDLMQLLQMPNENPEVFTQMAARLQQEMVQQQINQSPDLMQLQQMPNENPEHFQQVLTQMATVLAAARAPNAQMPDDILRMQLNAAIAKLSQSLAEPASHTSAVKETQPIRGLVKASRLQDEYRHLVQGLLEAGQIDAQITERLQS